MKRLNRSRALTILATVVGAMLVALLAGAASGTLSGWEVGYGIVATALGASAVLLVIMAVQGAADRRRDSGSQGWRPPT